MRYFLALCAVALSTNVHAATLTLTAAESGTNVVITGSGALDLGTATPFLAAVSPPATGILNANEASGIASGGLFGGPTVDVYSVTGLSFSNPLGATSASFVALGDPFSVGSNSLGSFVTVAAGYTSGDAIDFTWTVSGASFASLSIPTVETTFASFGSNEIKLVRGTLSSGGPIDTPTAVPVPASALLLAGAIALLLPVRCTTSRR